MKLAARLAIQILIISTTASAQTTLLFAPSIGRDIKLGSQYAEIKRQFPDGKEMGESTLKLLIVNSFRSGPWSGAVFKFENKRLSAITLTSEVTADEAETALKRTLTAAVREYGKPNELRLFRGDTDRLVTMFVWNRADANVYLGSPDFEPLPGAGHGVNGIRITLASKQEPFDQLVILPSAQQTERELIEHLLPSDLMNLVRPAVPGAAKP